MPTALKKEFDARLRISVIYHDTALEGDILTHSEIKAAIDPTIISNTSLIPAYDAIKAFNEASEHGAKLASGRNTKIKLDAIREIAEILNYKDPGQVAYRKDNPLHRLYYHEIARPEKISYRIRKLGEWLDTRVTQAMHPIERAARLHYKLMHVFPWAKLSGMTSRIVANAMLAQANYPIAVIHSIDRQHYYEALKQEGDGIVLLYLDAVEMTATSEMSVYDEAMRAPRRRRRA